MLARDMSGAGWLLEIPSRRLRFRGLRSFDDERLSHPSRLFVLFEYVFLAEFAWRSPFRGDIFHRVRTLDPR